MDDKLKKAVAGLGFNKQSIIFIAGLAGILLIAFARLPGQEAKAAVAVPQEEAPTTQGYEQKLEERLESVLKSIDGVGRVQVMVTLETGYGYEYAKESKTNNDQLDDTRDEEARKTQQKSITEENYVMVEASGGGKAPIVTKELEPTVKGVVVVCEGGADPITISCIIETVGVAAGVSSNRISVSRMGKMLS